MLKELLEKYSLTVEDLTAKGIDFNEISEDELEAKIIEVFDIQADNSQECDKCNGECNGECEKGDGEPEGNIEPETQPEGSLEPEDDVEPEGEPTDDSVDVKVLSSRIEELETENHSLSSKVNSLTEEIETLRQFKLDVEKADHEGKVAEMFSNFQLTEDDVEGLDIHAFSLEEIEEKCYAILGKKLASKKNFSKTEKNIHLPIGNDDSQKDEAPYGGLIEKYKNK